MLQQKQVPEFLGTETIKAANIKARENKGFYIIKFMAFWSKK